MALAQLFLQDKPIVLLDEVLEGLDEKNTTAILQNVKAHCQDRTVLYITHDISVLSHFDKVLKLSEINDN
jgi:ABC-type transport system involved in cytochrome bd biosynthesis fused ATPase/permease subunit